MTQYSIQYDYVIEKKGFYGETIDNWYSSWHCVEANSPREAADKAKVELDWLQRVVICRVMDDSTGRTEAEIKTLFNPVLVYRS